MDHRVQLADRGDRQRRGRTARRARRRSTRSATAGSASAICARDRLDREHRGVGRGRRCSRSRWSACSWVTSTAATPSRASRSVKEPGSMTTTWPSCSTRTQECPNLVILMCPDPEAGQPNGSSTKHQRQVLARLGGPHHRVVGLLEVRGRVPARRGVAAADVAAGQARAAGAPSGALRDAVLADARRRRSGRRRAADSSRCAHVGGRRPVPTAHRLGALRARAGRSVRYVEHRLLDVEGGQHVLDDLVRQPCRCCAPRAPARARPRASPGAAARRPRSASRRPGSVRRAAPRRRSRAARPGPGAAPSDGAERVVLAACSSSRVEPGRGGLLEQRGPGQRVLPRVGRGHPEPAGQPGQREPLAGTACRR